MFNKYCLFSVSAILEFFFFFLMYLWKLVSFVLMLFMFSRGKHCAVWASEEAFSFPYAENFVLWSHELHFALFFPPTPGTSSRKVSKEYTLTGATASPSWTTTTYSRFVSSSFSCQSSCTCCDFAESTGAPHSAAPHPLRRGWRKAWDHRRSPSTSKLRCKRLPFGFFEVSWPGSAHFRLQALLSHKKCQLLYLCPFRKLGGENGCIFLQKKPNNRQRLDFFCVGDLFALFF